MGPRRSMRACATAVVVAAAALAVSGGVSHADANAPGTVTSGHARFEVLSPTLIRMEYAGDDAFTDAPTFNAIGRDEFTHTDFTSSTVDGWLTISTGKATLKYKVGSGPFTAQNVSLAVNGVTAAPAFAPATFSCAQGSLCEAEHRPAQRRGGRHRPHRVHRHRLRGRLPGRRQLDHLHARRARRRHLRPAGPLRQQHGRRRPERLAHAERDDRRRRGLHAHAADDRGLEHLGSGEAQRSHAHRRQAHAGAGAARGRLGQRQRRQPRADGRGRPLSVGHAAGRHAVRLRHGVRGGGRRARGRREPRHRPRWLHRPRLRRRPGERERQGHDQRRERPGRRPLHAAPALRQRRRAASARSPSTAPASRCRRPPTGRPGAPWTSRSPSPRATARSCSPARAPPTPAGSTSTRSRSPRPAPRRRSPTRPLGGYRRGLDGVNGSAPVTPGLLYKDGWTCSTTRPRRCTTRPRRRSRSGPATASSPTRTTTSSPTDTTTSRRWATWPR